MILWRWQEGEIKAGAGYIYVYNSGDWKVKRRAGVPLHNGDGLDSKYVASEWSDNNYEKLSKRG